jgi:hypothetical protein
MHRSPHDHTNGKTGRSLNAIYYERGARINDVCGTL